MTRGTLVIYASGWKYSKTIWIFMDKIYTVEHSAFYHYDKYYRLFLIVAM